MHLWNHGVSVVFLSVKASRRKSVKSAVQAIRSGGGRYRVGRARPNWHLERGLGSLSVLTAISPQCHGCPAEAGTPHLGLELHVAQELEELTEDPGIATAKEWTQPWCNNSESSNLKHTKHVGSWCTSILHVSDTVCPVAALTLTCMEGVSGICSSAWLSCKAAVATS